MASLLGGLSGGREYVLKIVADVKDAVKGVDQVATQTTSMKDKMLGIGKSVAAGMAVTAVTAFGVASVQAAADAEDAGDMIVSAFGKSSKEIEKFSKDAADNMGLSATQYQTMAGKIGQTLTGFGVDQRKAASDTGVIMQRAADMAAIWGTTTEEAADAINNGILGSTRGLKKYGIAISESEISAKAMALGYVDASGKVTDAGKAIARQQLILEKTTKYQGEYAKNSKDLGSQQDQLRAKMDNLKVSIGNALLPVVIKLFDVLQPFIDFLAKNAGWLVPLAGTIMGIVAAIKLWTIAQAALNIVLMANPIVLLVVAIAALIGALVLAYMKIDWFRAGVDAMIDGIVIAFQWVVDAGKVAFNWIKDNWPLLLGILTGPFGLAIVLIQKNWDSIVAGAKWVWENIKYFFGMVYDIITWPFKRAGDVVDTVWDGMIAGAKWVIENLRYFFGMVFEILTWPFIQAAKVIATVWSGMIVGVKWLIENIGYFFGQVDDIITWPFKQAWSYIKTFTGWIIDAFKWVKDNIVWLFKGLADILIWPFKQAFNTIAWLWNNTLGRLNFTLPSWIPFLGGKSFGMPKIPMLAQGGIVNSPTIAMLGERGPEAVIPLDLLNPSSSNDSPANVTLNVYALTANAEVGRLVFNALRDFERTSGSRIFASTPIPSGF